MYQRKAPPELVLAALSWAIQQGHCSTASFAAHLGVGQSTVQRWLNGNRGLPQDRLLLAELFAHLGDDAPLLGFWLADHIRQSAQPLEPAAAIRQAVSEANKLLVILSRGLIEERSERWWRNVRLQLDRFQVALCDLDEAKPFSLRKRRSA